MKRITLLLFISSVLLLACAVTWLVPFYHICTKGTHTVNEPNGLVLGLEVALFILIASFAIFSFLEAIQDANKKIINDDSYLAPYDRLSSYSRRSDL